MGGLTTKFLNAKKQMGWYGYNVIFTHSVRFLVCLTKRKRKKKADQKWNRRT